MPTQSTDPLPLRYRIMAKLERLREEIAYRKHWQGIVVVTDISVVAWLLGSGDKAPPIVSGLALAGLFTLTYGALALHRRIERQILMIGGRNSWNS